PLRAFLLEERACRRRRAARCTACRWSLEKLDVVDGHEAAISLALGELTRGVAPDALRREMQAGERAQNGARIIPGVAPLIDHPRGDARVVERDLDRARLLRDGHVPADPDPLAGQRARRAVEVDAQRERLVRAQPESNARERAHVVLSAGERNAVDAPLLPGLDLVR